MQIYPYPILILLHRLNGFSNFWGILFAKLHLLNFVSNFDYNFWCFGSYQKIIESRYIGISPTIDKIIDIGRRLPQIIGNFRDLSAKLSISKLTGELSKIYRYRKKWLIAHSYPWNINHSFTSGTCWILICLKDQSCRQLRGKSESKRESVICLLPSQWPSNLLFGICKLQNDSY